jgi:flagellar biosynthesis protein FlhF
MIIKKFVAETMNEALAKIKSELGDDAVILQSKKVEKGGVLNILGKSMVEVTAATPDRHPPPPKPDSMKLEKHLQETLDKANLEHPGKSLPNLGVRQYGAKTGYAPQSGINTKTARSKTDLIDRENFSPINKSKNGEDVKEIKEQISDLKNTVNEIAERLSETKKSPEFPDPLKTVWQELVSNGTSEKNSTEICQNLNKSLSKESLNDEEVLETELNQTISNMIRTSNLDDTEPRYNRPLVIAIVGPTGVGKTTTLAKLATNQKILKDRSFALISTDTYRVAAVEQLRTFAGIAGIPMDVVYRPGDLPQSIEKYKDKDVVLIDTAGRSQNDTEALVELKEFMDEAQPDEIILVLSASTRLQDIKSTIKKFNVVNTTKVILSKIDEISGAGHLVDVAELLPKSWIYLTTGQNVPDDIIAADKYLISAMVSRMDYFEQLRDNSFVINENI